MEVERWPTEILGYKGKSESLTNCDDGEAARGLYQQFLRLAPKRDGGTCLSDADLPARICVIYARPGRDTGSEAWRVSG
jgi:hypothetical protein